MKKFFTVLSLTLGLLMCSSTFVACSSDDDEKDSPSNPLVGTWRAEIEEKGEQQYWDMTFYADYTCVFLEHNKYDDKVHNLSVGTYEIIGDNILRTTTDSEYYHEKGVTRSLRFKITDGNKFEFLDHDHGIIYYKIKQKKDNNQFERNNYL